MLTFRDCNCSSLQFDNFDRSFWMERLKKKMKEVIFEFLCTDCISLSEIMKVEAALFQLEELEVRSRESYLETKNMLRRV